MDIRNGGARPKTRTKATKKGGSGSASNSSVIVGLGSKFDKTKPKREKQSRRGYNEEEKSEIRNPFASIAHEITDCKRMTTEGKENDKTTCDMDNLDFRYIDKSTTESNHWPTIKNLGRIRENMNKNVEYGAQCDEVDRDTERQKSEKQEPARGSNPFALIVDKIEHNKQECIDTAKEMMETFDEALPHRDDIMTDIDDDTVDDKFQKLSKSLDEGTLQVPDEDCARARPTLDGTENTDGITFGFKYRDDFPAVCNRENTQQKNLRRSEDNHCHGATQTVDDLLSPWIKGTERYEKKGKKKKWKAITPLSQSKVQSSWATLPKSPTCNDSSDQLGINIVTGQGVSGDVGHDHKKSFRQALADGDETNITERTANNKNRSWKSDTQPEIPTYRVPPDTHPYVPPDTRPYVQPEIPATYRVPPDTRPYVPPDTRPYVPPDTRPYVPPEIPTYPVPPDTHPYVPPDTRPYVPPDTRPKYVGERKKADFKRERGRDNGKQAENNETQINKPLHTTQNTEVNTPTVQTDGDIGEDQKKNEPTQAQLNKERSISEYNLVFQIHRRFFTNRNLLKSEISMKELSDLFQYVANAEKENGKMRHHFLSRLTKTEFLSMKGSVAHFVRNLIQQSLPDSSSIDTIIEKYGQIIHSIVQLLDEMMARIPHLTTSYAAMFCDLIKRIPDVQTTELADGLAGIEYQLKDRFLLVNKVNDPTQNWSSDLAFIGQPVLPTTEEILAGNLPKKKKVPTATLR